MEITEEQRKRAESNRLAALAKRKAILESTTCLPIPEHPWRLSKCQKQSPKLTTSFPKQQSLENTYIDPFLKPHFPEKFRARLEIYSPDSFSVTPEPAKGFLYLGETECLRKLRDYLLDVIPSDYAQNQSGGKAILYKLENYNAVWKCLKNSKGIELEEIPRRTLNVLQRLLHSHVTGQWIPCRPEHLSDEEVDKLIGEMPKTLFDALLPFQIDGLRFGLQRGGRCLIADEMGLGKTLQAIAIACCFMNEGSILVVCPAILRYSWAEELERWLPFCLPGDIHLVFSHQNNPSYLTRCPRVVVISYTMLHHLQKSMLEQDWAVLIVDESHHVRSTKKKSEPEETKTVLDVAAKVKRIVLLSGTPSLSRPFDIFHQINMLWPGLLGTNKFEFAKTYCVVKYVQGSQGKIFQDFSKGIRLEELHVLLIQTVMIRRLKEQVLVQLPPKRRQIISLVLKRSDIISIDAAIKVENSENACKDVLLENLDEPSGKPSAVQLVGIAKLPGFREWLSIHPIIAGSDGAESLGMNPSSQKMIIFAHHHKVLDGVQEFICEKGIGFVRIDGRTSARDRKLALSSFQSSAEVKIAIIGIRAGGSGLDLSIAQNVVFLELPRSPADMSQAEDRAHRRGQTKAVNIYIFCAKDTPDESHWQYLNKSLCRVSSTTDGRNAIQEIEVEDVSFIDMSNKTYGNDESWVLDSLGYNEVTAEQMKLSHAGLDQAIDNEVAEKDKSEGNVSEVQIGSPRRVSSCRVDEDINERGQEADESYLSQVDSLRFEVSQYTGRIHLYSCIPGTDLRPRPLFENFRPEEIESLNSGGAISDKIRENPAHRQAILAFINEWNNLRSIEQKKLIGKPLQLPLTVELLCLSESNTHGSEGLLKWGSKRRHTPLNELSHPLPSDAVLRDISLCSRNGKKEKVYTQGWSLTNEPLCKYCQAPCESKNAKTPAYFEDLFCTFDCYEEYRMRTSDRFLRQELFQLEHGVCTNCKLDCHKLVEHLKPLSLRRRLEYIVKVAPKVTKQKNLLDKLINDPIEGNAWHADHIVPVYRGGGECKVENMRTLCVACHSDFTAAQCADRCSTRVEAKKKLKVIMSKLKNSQNLEGKHANSEDSRVTRYLRVVFVRGLARREVLRDVVVVIVFKFQSSYPGCDLGLY